MYEDTQNKNSKDFNDLVAQCGDDKDFNNKLIHDLNLDK